MRYERLFTKLFCQPVLVESSFRAGLEMALIAMMRGQVPVTPPMVQKIDPKVSDYRADQILEIRGETAIVHIDGAIDKNIAALDRISFDATDLNDVDEALKRVFQDKGIKNLMLAIDSPGGSFPGVPETGQRVAALSSVVNTAAYMATGCSAAYWIGCCADQLFVSGSSAVGSIGVYAAFLDESVQNSLLGLKVESFQDGKYKTAGAPWKPLTDEEREYLQDRVDEIGAMFRGAVSERRPNIAASDMEAQVYLGADAVKAGFADQIVVGLDEAIARAF
jgi:signal peptide peptidase SppA